MTELLVERGVELIAAVIFLFVLLKALKRKPHEGLQLSTVGGNGQDSGMAGIEEIEDPRIREMMARRQIDELVKNDPERVSLILSRWVAEDMKASRN